MNPVTDTPACALAAKYLTFALGRESYGVAVLQVREIIKLLPITQVPQMPPHIKGVINLRGKIIPVADLRIKFGLGDIKDTEKTCIVVVQVELQAQKRLQMGLVVDEVEEVISLTGADVEPSPEFGTAVDTTYLLGMVKVKGAVKMLLDINRVVAGDGVATLPSLI
jgi:purine-binding chemotaxis protein CheW